MTHDGHPTIKKLGSEELKVVCVCVRVYTNRPIDEVYVLDPCLPYDVASGSEVTPCNKIDKPLVVYRFTGNVMTSIATLRT